MQRTLWLLAVGCAPSGTTSTAPAQPTGETGGSWGTLEPLPPGTASTPAPEPTEPPEPHVPRLFAYVGTDDDRIHVHTVDAASGALTEVSAVDAGQGPSYVAFSADLRYAYAVNEHSAELAAFAVDGATGALAFLDRRPTRGGGPAYAVVDATDRWAFGVNYGGGNFTMFAIEPDGSLGPPRATLATGAGAHELVFDPAQRFAFVPNYGSDTVTQLVFDAATGDIDYNDVPQVPMPAGSGPRHLVFHPTAPFAYVVEEEGDSISVASYDDAVGRLTVLETVTTLPPGVDGEGSYCAELAFGPTGRFLYATNRGHDSIAVFDVDPLTGHPAAVADVPTGGDWPRHFSLVGDLLLVAHQRSHDVVAFRIGADGLLTELARTPTAPGPGFVGLVDLPL